MTDEILNTLTAEGQNGGGGSSLQNPRTDNVEGERERERKLIKLNNKGQAQSVYDCEGLSCTLSANGGGQGGKTGLYLVKND